MSKINIEHGVDKLERSPRIATVLVGVDCVINILKVSRLELQAGQRFDCQKLLHRPQEPSKIKVWWKVETAIAFWL